MKYILYISLISILCGSCRVRHELAPFEFAKWIENPSNGLLIEQEMSDLIFKLQYKPIEYITVVQNRKLDLSKAEYERTRSKMNGLQYFTFKISPKNEKNPVFKKVGMSDADYSKRVNYFSFEMQRDLYLVDGQDSLACLLYHYENANNIKLEHTFLLGFDLPADNKVASNKKLVFNNSFMETGIVEMVIYGNDLANIPDLKLK